MAFRRLVLADGRALAWREYGDPGGFPVIFLHGNLNSRLFAPAWADSDAQSRAAGARVIALDRPGYGQSDFLPGRSYATAPGDLTQLAAELGLSKLAVLGFSSGGPNALACAAGLGGGLVSGLGLVSSDGPYSRMGMVPQMYGCGAEGLEMEAALSRMRLVEQGMREGYEQMKKPDRRAIALADLDEAVRQGLEGAAQDSVLESKDWGFELEGIGKRMPVLAWHGTADSDVPVEVGRYLEEHLEIKMNIIEGENHTLVRRHWKSILEQLVQATKEGEALVDRYETKRPKL